MTLKDSENSPAKPHKKPSAAEKRMPELISIDFGCGCKAKLVNGVWSLSHGHNTDHKGVQLLNEMIDEGHRLQAEMKNLSRDYGLRIMKLQEPPPEPT